MDYWTTVTQGPVYCFDILGLLTRNTIKHHLGSVVLAEESLAVGLLLLLAQQGVQAVELGLLVTVDIVPENMDHDIIVIIFSDVLLTTNHTQSTAG